MGPQTRTDLKRRPAVRISVGLVLAVGVAAVGLLAASAMAGSSKSSATISLRSTKLGAILVNSKGRTLYLFGKDKNGKSACAGQCVQFWPPLIAHGNPTVGKGLKASLVRLVRRSDGKMQVSYNRHPLYTFSQDKRAGQLNGQGFSAFGARWWTVSAKGKAVTKAPSSGGGGTTTTPPPTTTTNPYPPNPYP
jgi:predicted lipoprotein with Yx(FWY)xxD motif